MFRSLRPAVLIRTLISAWVSIRANTAKQCIHLEAWIFAAKEASSQTMVILQEQGSALGQGHVMMILLYGCCGSCVLTSVWLFGTNRKRQ